ncbi:MAG: DUF6036 family nucleotidyltransferase [Armatimonadota bacterium]
MISLPKDLREFIGLLNSNEVRYLIVGGYAVAYHGYPRSTGDIDFLLQVSEENASRVIEALREFGFSSLGLRPADLLQEGIVIQLGYPPNRIDLLTGISGATFDDAWEKRIEDEFDGLTLIFVDLETLRANKAATGRPKDLADLDALS